MHGVEPSARLIGPDASSGLDAIVRRDILGAVLRTIADEGRTVLFSSHLLEEVEQVADHVTMIREGKILVSAPLKEVKDAHGVASLDEIFVERMGGVWRMRTPAAAIAWEFLQRHRWGLIGMLELAGHVHDRMGDRIAGFIVASKRHHRRPSADRGRQAPAQRGRELAEVVGGVTRQARRNVQVT